MSIEAHAEVPASVVVIPGLFPNLPGFGERIRHNNNVNTKDALDCALGELATVALYDPGYHDEDLTPSEKQETLYEHITDLYNNTGQSVRVIGASLGGNLALGASVRLGPARVTRGVAVSPPLRSEKSPPPTLRLPNGDDLTFVKNTMEILGSATPEKLARLAIVHGAHDIFVKPELSEWDGIEVHIVPGFLHPRIIRKALSNPGLMQKVLLELQPSAE